MRRAVLFVVAFVSLVVPRPSFAASAVRADADWLLAVQTGEGIVTQGIDKTWCVPYFANIGVRGLAYAYAASHDARYASAAWRWLDWYQAHMDANGFVTDYRIDDNGIWKSTGTKDSTDSYAATFLSAVHDVFAVTSDRDHLYALRPGIWKAVSAIDATTDRDGLTWAKPDYKMKYLMDNSEVYEGWVAATDLAVAIGDSALHDKAASRAAAIRSRWPSYLSTSDEGFDWAIGETGIHEQVDWAQFYPSSSAQAWPVTAGLIAKKDAKPLMEKLDAAQPGWDQPDWHSEIVDHDDAIGYWSAIALGFFDAGLEDRALQGWERLEEYAASKNRYWPFHPGTAGALLMLAAHGEVGTEAFTPPPTPPPSPSPSPSPSSAPTPSPSPTATPSPTPAPAGSPAPCAIPSRGICELLRRYA